MDRRKPGCNRKERGQTLVLFVLALGVLCGMTAMSVDVGLILLQRTDLQKTVDAAALAGATELPDDPAEAMAKAEEWAEKNGVDLEDGDDVEVTVSDDQTRLTVEVTRGTPYIFARVLGLDYVDVGASATAEATASEPFTGVMPWAVLEDAIEVDGDPTVLKCDSNNGSNGNFGALRLDGNGASIYEDNIKYGVEEPLCSVSMGCVDPTAPTEPGNMTGPTGDGVDYRLDNTSSEDPDCREFDQVFVANDEGEYDLLPECDPFNGVSGSMRVILAPVVESFCNGACTVTIQYFVLVFLNDLETCKGNSCEVTGRFAQIVENPVTELGVWGESGGAASVRLVE